MKGFVFFPARIAKRGEKYLSTDAHRLTQIFKGFFDILKL